MTRGSNVLAGIELVLRPSELMRHWERCGTTADWIASYLAHDIESTARAGFKNVFSTVINELLENAAKFSTNGPEPIKIAAHHLGAFVRIETWNTTPEARARLLEQTLADLAQTNLDSLFGRRVASGGEAKSPGIGLLIIKRDYDARIQAALTPRDNGSSDVHMTVDLDVARVRG
jgi:hypothetical protein